MQVNFAHVCDYATVSREGKLSVMGIFENVYPPSLPFLYPMMYLAFEIEASISELNRQFHIEMRLADADGGVLFSAQGDATWAIEPGTTVQQGMRPKIPQILQVAALQLPKYGTYTFSIFLNGDLKKEAEFHVIEGGMPMAGRTGTRLPPGGLRQ